MFNSEALTEKWSPVLSHEGAGAIKDNYRKAVTAVLLENTEKQLREEVMHWRHQIFLRKPQTLQLSFIPKLFMGSVKMKMLRAAMKGQDFSLIKNVDS